MPGRYLISRERVDVGALYDPNGRYGRWNLVALTSYAVGVVAQVSFLAQKLYTGPATEALGGADISWIVGHAGRPGRERLSLSTRNCRLLVAEP